LSVISLLGLGADIRALAMAPGSSWQMAAAATLYLASGWLFLCARRACGAHRLSSIHQQDQPVHIVASGPFGRIRHPFYSSYLLFWLAGFVAGSGASTAAVVLVMALIYLRAARAEEAKFAASRLCQAYRDYARQTGLFVPGL
jgi:protein-S-isoprenylcysteine O-methyltransferase Ste14